MIAFVKLCMLCCSSYLKKHGIIIFMQTTCLNRFGNAGKPLFRRAIFAVIIAAGALWLVPVLAKASSEEGGEERGQDIVSKVAKPHDDLSCKDCHGDHVTNSLDKTDRPCIKCHKDQTGKDSHPSGISHEGEAPKGLPLSKEGMITCYTCHILHETEVSTPGLLRKKFDDLCMSCHMPRHRPKDDSNASEGHP